MRESQFLKICSSNVEYLESDFQECHTGQGLMEKETNAFKSCFGEEILCRLLETFEGEAIFTKSNSTTPPPHSKNKGWSLPEGMYCHSL